MNEELNLDDLQAQFEKDFPEDQEEVLETDENMNETEDQEDASDLDIEEDQEGIEDEENIEDETLDQEQEEETPDFQTEKQNSAFAQMRREKEELQKQLQDMQKYNNVIKEIADQSGVTPDELLNRYEQQKLEQEAQQQNVPVEFLQQQRQMQSELERMKQERFEERFNSNVQKVVEKYDLSQEDIQSTMAFAFQNGIDLTNTNVNFESIYKMANFDTILDKQLKSERQKQLENKQKRMKQSSIKNGGSATQTDSVDDEVAAFLKEQGF